MTTATTPSPATIRASQALTKARALIRTAEAHAADLPVELKAILNAGIMSIIAKREAALTRAEEADRRRVSLAA